MSDRDVVEQAKDVVSQYWDTHPFRTRKIGSVGIGLANSDEQRDDNAPEYAVFIGILGENTPLPPKFAPAIADLLQVAGLEKVQINYWRINQPESY